MHSSTASLLVGGLLVGNVAAAREGKRRLASAYVTINAPPMGANTPVSGTVTGLNCANGAYKGILLVSGDNGATYWDKSHSRYLNLGVPNPGQAQNAGVPIAADCECGSSGVWGDEALARPAPPDCWGTVFLRAAPSLPRLLVAHTPCRFTRRRAPSRRHVQLGHVDVVAVRQRCVHHALHRAAVVL